MTGGKSRLHSSATTGKSSLHVDIPDASQILQINSYRFRLAPWTSAESRSMITHIEGFAHRSKRVG
jgi:hypothetical protein